MNLFSFAQDWKELNRFESLDISERSIVFYAETKASMNYFKILIQELTEKKSTKYLTKAFQRRFRNELVDGNIDFECLLLSKNLVKN